MTFELDNDFICGVREKDDLSLRVDVEVEPNPRRSIVNCERLDGERCRVTNEVCNILDVLRNYRAGIQ